MSKKKGTNKNQTAALRSDRRQSEAAQLTQRTCFSSQCARPGQRIALGDLVSAKVVTNGKGRIRHFHRGCYSAGV